ncbi:MAG: gamma-glutamyltransferase, partial [Phycisphaerales bacterium]
PRIHHQWLPDALYAEPGLMPMLSRRAAPGDWNELRPRRDIGNVQLIKRDPQGRGWQSASDPRKGGVPAGVD